MHGLDDDEPLDRRQVELGRLADVELVGVQAVELAHVSRQRARERRDRARVEPPHGEHGRERVEVGVRVRGDDGLGPHWLEFCLRRGSNRPAARQTRRSSTGPRGPAVTVT